MSSVAFRSRSGGMDDRPMQLYIPLNVGDISLSTASTKGLIARNGCRSGTRFSGEIKVGIVACFVSRPRMVSRDHSRYLLSIPQERPFHHLTTRPRLSPRLPPLHLSCPPS